MYKIEEVNYDNYHQVCSLVIEHCKMAGKTYDEVSVGSGVGSFLINDDPYKVAFVLTNTETGDSVGYLGASLIPDSVSNEYTAIETGFFCTAKGQGHILVSAFEDWARNINATRTVLGSRLTDGLDKYYEKLGYTQIEKLFAKELK